MCLSTVVGAHIALKVRTTTTNRSQAGAQKGKSVGVRILPRVSLEKGRVRVGIKISWGSVLMAGAGTWTCLGAVAGRVADSREMSVSW